jgi:hypothetical protein
LDNGMCPRRAGAMDRSLSGTDHSTFPASETLASDTLLEIHPSLARHRP